MKEVNSEQEETISDEKPDVPLDAYIPKNTEDVVEDMAENILDVQEPPVEIADVEAISIEQPVMESIKLLVASKSRSNKDINEDYHASFENKQLNLSGVIVADGLGSHSYCDIGSREVVEFVKKKLEILESIEHLNLNILFKEAKDYLIDFAENDKEIDFETIDKNKAFGTTLIVAIEYKSRFIIAYVGNGAIWHIRGNFNRFSGTEVSNLLPCNAINYLNPHSLIFEGREILYKLISISEDYYQSEPTIIEINADTEYGDIIMICTDGIYSYDQAKMGVRNGFVWVRDEKINLFFTALNQFLSKNAFEVNNENINLFIKEHLESITIDDDATIGIIMNNLAIEFQKKLKNANLKNK